MRYTRSAVALVAGSLLTYAYLFVRFTWEFATGRVTPAFGGALLAQILFFMAATVLMFLIQERGKYRIILALHVLVYLIFQSIFGYVISTEIILVALIIMQIATYENWPGNLAVCGLLLFIASLFRLEYLREIGTISLVEVLFAQGEFLLIGGLVAVSATTSTYYREALIPLQQENERLESAASELSRTNLSYQNYAQSIHERAMLQERKRLTRDMHDIVGYSLTNLQMVLRAVKIMAKSEPEKIPALVDTATENAEIARQEIREVLRNLRERDEAIVSGLKAITRLVKTFGEATSIDVRIEYGNLVWDFDRVHESIIYHFVQEGMINSFRHGRAQRIQILFWREDGAVRVTIMDDGQSSPPDVTEGIGLTGMRERLELVEGWLEIDPRADGFTISMVLPMQVSGESSETGGQEDGSELPYPARGRPEALRELPEVRP